MKSPKRNKILPDGDLPEIVLECEILNKCGVHGRPAALFVKLANRYTSMIFVEKDGERVDGKSIVGFMMLAAGPGSKITIRARGLDAKEAVTELASLLLRKFDEE